MSMKKGIWMTVLTIITVCCVVGGTFHYYGIFGFWDGFRFGADRMSNADSDLDAFDAIRVDADMMDLSIETGEHFHLSSQYTDTLKLEYEVKDGILNVKEKNPKRALWGGRRSEQCSMTLTVPEGTELNLMDIKIAMGNIGAEGITSKDCDALTNMGNCIFKRCNFDEADIDTNMGEITIKDTYLGEAEVDNDMGAIKIDNCTFHNLDVDNAMGDTAIDANQSLAGYQIELEAGMGEVRVNGQGEGTKYRQSGSSGKLEASTSMGSVRLSYRNAE